MSVSPSSRPYAERIWDLVPGWTRWRDEHSPGTGLLHGLVKALGVGLDAVKDDVGRLLDDMFVDTCDPRLIPLIGDLVGVSIDPNLPTPRQRHQVKYAIYLRRHQGTSEALQELVWQKTGFRVSVREPTTAPRSIRDPLLSARLSGSGNVLSFANTVEVTGRIPTGRVEVVVDVAWPIRRSQSELVPIGPDVHALSASRPIGLRRSDGTPILVSDDPALFVGKGRAIELDLIGADFDRLGTLTPRFMRMSGMAPVYVPPRTLAIDPELGRVAGPTAPTPGIQFYRKYRLRYWEALSLEPLPRDAAGSDALTNPIVGESVVGRPYSQPDGVFAFAPDGAAEGLTDAYGIKVKLVFEGGRNTGRPNFDERLLLVLDQSANETRHQPCVLFEAGVALRTDRPPRNQGLLLDKAGLNRLFSIEDEWGWDRFSTVRLVTAFGRNALPDNTVEVDVQRGLFRINPARTDLQLTVRHFRRFDVAAAKRLAEEVLRAELPLGCAATFVFRDTAPGRTEVHQS